MEYHFIHSAPNSRMGNEWNMVYWEQAEYMELSACLMGSLACIQTLPSTYCEKYCCLIPQIMATTNINGIVYEKENCLASVTVVF